MNVRALGQFVLKHPFRPVKPLNFPGMLDSSSTIAFHMISEVPDAELMPPSCDTSMWAVRNKTLVLFDVDRNDVENLSEHWVKYNLHARVGPPCECAWGVLDYLDDFRS